MPDNKGVKLHCESWIDPEAMLDESRLLGQGMSKAARAADVAQSDREYIAQRQARERKAKGMGAVFKDHLEKLRKALETGDVETAKSHLKNVEMAAAGATHLSPEAAKHLDKNGVPYMYEDRENEFAANLSLAGDHSASKPSKPVKLKRADGSVHSEHDTESSAMSAFKNEKDNKGMKIVREAVDVEFDAAELVEGKHAPSFKPAKYRQVEFPVTITSGAGVQKLVASRNRASSSTADSASAMAI
jgi:hypothetical protein